MDLYDEFVSILEVLEAGRIPYAVCGGMAMAIHGFPRATVDVDLLVPTDAAAQIVAAVSPAGLIALKRLRGSGQDQDDIRHLEGLAP